MKHIRYVLVAVFGLFSMFVPSAFASVTTVSTDPAFATSFSFYCQPYKAPFQSGYHYMPSTNAGAGCIYSLPNTLSGSRVIELRKGTPTNSVLLSVNNVGATPTLVRAQPHGLPLTPAAEDDFFAVVYDSSLGSAFATYLSSGGALPGGAVEGQSYYILPWKWGPKMPAEFEPVVIVPEILTTWQTSSGAVVDPIYHQYQNLIDTLVANGYVLNQNLFLFPYNWEQSNTTTATQLKNFIATVKTTSGSSHVDLVGHGMGGLIAQHYITSGAYGNDVEQLLMIGTPLYGAPSAYLAWEGAQVRLGNTTTDTLAQALLTQEAKDSGYSSAFDYIQNKPVLSFKELLPGQLSSYFLSGTPPQNQFLEDLVTGFAAFYAKVDASVFMSDDGLMTTPEFIQTVASTNPPLWPDGEPTDIFPGSGDGLVPNSSIQFVLEPDYFASVAHQDFPTAAQSDIFLELNGVAPTTLVTQNYPVSCVLFLTTSQPTDMQVTDPNGDRLGSNFSGGTYNEIQNAFYSGVTAPTEYGVVVNPIAGNYQVTTQGTGSGSFTINTTEVCGGTVGTTTATVPTTPGQIVGFNLVVTPDAQGTSITVQALDTLPPVVTINSPVHGQTYVSTLTIPLSVTITDPENSPIATTVYKLNGNVFAATTTLNLATLPLGTSTLVVSATDSFGHTGYATSSFSVVAPPPTYIWGGFLQPINDTGHEITNNVSVFKGNSTIPVKFRVTNAQGQAIQTTATPVWITPVKLNPMSAPITESVYTDSPSSGILYEWKGDHYQYNWKTKGFQTGYWYRLYVVLDDGTIQSVVIGLR